MTKKDRCFLLKIARFLLNLPSENKKFIVQLDTMDLFGNPVGFLTGLAFFQAKALQKCSCLGLLFGKLKFPNSSSGKFIAVSPYFTLS